MNLGQLEIPKKIVERVGLGLGMKNHDFLSLAGRIIIRLLSIESGVYNVIEKTDFLYIFIFIINFVFVFSSYYKMRLHHPKNKSQQTLVLEQKQREFWNH